MKEERRQSLSYQAKEGYYAFSKGWMRNQYPLSSSKGKEWQRGFDRAYFENLDRITRNAEQKV